MPSIRKYRRLSPSLPQGWTLSGMLRSSSCRFLYCWLMRVRTASEEESVHWTSVRRRVSWDRRGQYVTLCRL